MIIQDSLFESLESLALELCAAWDDWVTSCFELVIVDHQVTGKNETNLALAPSSVDIDEVLGWYTASFEVLWIPRRQTLGLRDGQLVSSLSNNGCSYLPWLPSRSDLVHLYRQTQSEVACQEARRRPCQTRILLMVPYLLFVINQL